MKNIAILIFFLISNMAWCQESEADTLDHDQYLKFSYPQLVIPSVLIGYGVVGIESDALKFFNSEIKEEIDEHIDNKISFDDFAQFAPMAAVYVLNLAGVEGKNSFKDRTIILGTATIMMATTVTVLKNVTHVERPDGSSNNSFPSGHTATAFMGAEFLWQEYKDKSVWYGISGYAIASAAGAFRMYNNRHWLTDVAAGAGIGMLSTKAAYWMQPFIQKKVFKNSKSYSGTAYPYYNGNDIGLGMMIGF